MHVSVRYDIIVIMSESYTSTFANLLKGYEVEIGVDTKIDRLNLPDMQMKLPAIKGKWVGRLTQAKIRKGEYETVLRQLISNISTSLKKQSGVAMADVVAERAAEKDDKVVQLRNEIKLADLLIEYLENVVRLMHSMTYDIRNIVEIIKQEQT